MSLVTWFAVRLGSGSSISPGILEREGGSDYSAHPNYRDTLLEWSKLKVILVGKPKK